jgi:hypothetical protein
MFKLPEPRNNKTRNEHGLITNKTNIVMMSSPEVWKGSVFSRESAQEDQGADWKEFQEKVAVPDGEDFPSNVNET